MSKKQGEGNSTANKVLLEGLPSKPCGDVNEEWVALLNEVSHGGQFGVSENVFHHKVRRDWWWWQRVWWVAIMDDGWDRSWWPIFFIRISQFAYTISRKY